MFRFEYPIDFLRWILCPPNYVPSWHIGIRLTTNKKLVAFISGIPVKMMVHGTEVKMAEINFLCIHKKLRTNRMAPVLIKEVTRRVNLKKIWQAIYTAELRSPSLSPLPDIITEISTSRNSLTFSSPPSSLEALSQCRTRSTSSLITLCSRGSDLWSRRTPRRSTS